MKTSSGWHRRQAAWVHNGYRGRVLGARGVLLAVLHSATATNESKRLALAALPLIEDLAKSLRVRRDQEEGGNELGKGGTGTR